MIKGFTIPYYLGCTVLSLGFLIVSGIVMPSRAYFGVSGLCLLFFGYITLIKIIMEDKNDR